MRLFPLVTLGILAVFTSCAPTASGESEETSDLLVTATACEGPLQIDGRMDEPAYARARPVTLVNSETTEAVADSSYRTTVYALYDDRYLYLAFDCYDKDIHTSYTTRDEHLWEEEAVEVFIDVDDSTPNTYVEIEVSPSNVLYDSYIVDPVHIDVPATSAFNLKNIHTAVQVDGTLDDRQDQDRRWTVEMAVPLAELADNFSPKQLSTFSWRINFYRLNLDDYGARAFAWSPTQGSFHKPDRFGRLVFR